LEKEDLNGAGLLLKSLEEVFWEPLQNKVSTKEAIVADFIIQPEGGISGNVSFMVSGYGTVKQRQMIQEKDAQQMLTTTFKEWAAEGTFADVTVDHPSEWQEPLMKTDFQLKTTSFATSSGDKIYLSPTLGLGQRENPFKNPERKANIDMGAPHDESYNLTFAIPPGYKVEEVPKSAKMAFGENALSFDYIVETTPQAVKIIVKNKAKKPYFSVEQYTDLKQFFTIMATKLEEQVVLTKIGG
jgi:hypothetical protein